MPRQPFPGAITAIEPQAKVRKHLGQRVNVFISDRFSFAIDASLMLRHGLRPGFFISPQLLEELLREDGDARAYARALQHAALSCPALRRHRAAGGAHGAR